MGSIYYYAFFVFETIHGGVSNIILFFVLKNICEGNKGRGLGRRHPEGYCRLIFEHLYVFESAQNIDKDKTNLFIQGSIYQWFNDHGRLLKKIKKHDNN